MNSQPPKPLTKKRSPLLQASWIAEQEFRCVSPSGDSFAASARIGTPTRVVPDDGMPAFARCQVSLLPIATQRSSGGENEFQALCLAIEFIRNALKSFVAEGGKVYFGNSNNPANLESPWFAPLLSLAELARENQITSAKSLKVQGQAKSRKPGSAR